MEWFLNLIYKLKKDYQKELIKVKAKDILKENILITNTEQIYDVFYIINFYIPDLKIEFQHKNQPFNAYIFRHIIEHVNYALTKKRYVVLKIVQRDSMNQLRYQVYSEHVIRKSFYIDFHDFKTKYEEF